MTNEELTTAQKAEQEKNAARVNELKALTGKWFVSKVGNTHPVVVTGYAGVGMRDGQQYHLLQVEMPGHARWTPPAIKFLDEYVETQSPKTETKNEGVK